MTNLVITGSGTNALDTIAKEMLEMGVIKDDDEFVNYQQTFEAVLSHPKAQEIFDRAEDFVIMKEDNLDSLSCSLLVTGFSQTAIPVSAIELMKKVALASGTCLRMDVETGEPKLDDHDVGKRAGFLMVGNARTNVITAVMYLYIYRYLANLKASHRDGELGDMELSENLTRAIATRENMNHKSIIARGRKAKTRLANVM